MSQVHPILKRLHCPDIDDLDAHRPDDPENFSFLLEAYFGTGDEPGEDSFQMVVCTPKWLDRNLPDDVTSGRHRLIVKRYDIGALRAWLEKLGRRCASDDWETAAAKLGRFGLWEFEDYTPHKAAG
jgi:hypothetical protein